MLRFGTNPEEWEEDAKFVWEDYIDAALPLDILVVRPSPPTRTFPGIAVTVILQQRFDLPRTACLFSVIANEGADIPFTEVAHSFLPQSSAPKGSKNIFLFFLLIFGKNHSSHEE